MKFADVEVLSECSVRALAVGVKEHNITLQEVLAIGRAADELKALRALADAAQAALPHLQGTYAADIMRALDISRPGWRKV
jgi:hypothetical protein